MTKLYVAPSPIRLSLPEVTLVAVDAQNHDLTRKALEDSMTQVEFGDVLVFTDSFRACPVGTTWIECKLTSIQQAFNFLWYEVPKHLKTSHYLLVQWDGWVIDATQWRTEFLDYDYIGAPWWYQDGHNVGNGGFSLRSNHLIQFLMEYRDLYPVIHPDDDTLCRRYRTALEHEGFKWADETLAGQFSFETTRPSLTSRHFGFHAMRNWPFVLNHDRLAERLGLCNGYVLKQRDQLEWMLRNIHILGQAKLPCG